VWLLLPPEPRVLGLVLPEQQHERRDSNRSGDASDEDPAEVIVGDQAASWRHNRHSTNIQQDDANETTSLLSRRSSTSSSTHKGPAVSLSRALAIPGVIEFSLSLFFAKLVSYTFLYWLPMYINTSTHLTPKESSTLSTVFDVGGIAGAILAGLVADCTGCPALVCGVFYIVCAPMLFVYERWGASSYGVNVILLIVNGALVNGPYALITTAVAAELGTHSTLVGNSQALATVTAIIDGTGSIGAAVGPMMAGVVSSTGSWTHVFYLLISCTFFALLLLLRIMKTEVIKLRQDRRAASPRVVRIE
ncbi:glucose-6-phosphate exchanger SLC37A2-like, partial [Hyposmocoma kahamanoa]|uniref:glucose-6-phosphate exchanger SLC37A2-like n=1 Tax=Hyposmocoma kahamanoa TaxID=1477025 RepID=UPI000E6D96B8